jgi:hypothetical protein
MNREELLKRYSARERDFSYADLSHANLSDADLRNIGLRGADLRGADFRGADFRGADLRYANLRGADLSDANLRGANLRGADLSDANIDYASWPIWCGSKHVKVDKKIAMQLAAHFCTLVCDDQEVKEAQASILAFAKKSHIAHHILEV